MTSVPKVSVIVRSYQEARFIRRLFIGLQSQTFRDFEIILVDSGSTDGTIEIAESFGARILRIAKAEFSFGRSLNIGCAAAKGAILVFASAHVYPTQTDWLEYLVAPFSDPAVSIVYGRQRGNEITRFSEHRVFEQWYPNQSIQNQSHSFCNNANCAVRRDAWQSVRYDEILAGLEDLAFAKDIRRRGGRIAYSAEAEIIHVHEETWGQVYNRYYREAIALREIDPAIRFGIYDFFRLTFMSIISDLMEARRQRAVLREAKSILLFRYNQFWGTYLGHLQHPKMSAQLRNRLYFPPRARTGSKADDTAHDQTDAPIGGPKGAARIDYDTLEGSIF